jgi:rfaE bifunctional protein nucleotidyltransferase chain/domain
MDPQTKILTLEQVDAWVATERGAGRRIGFTCGSFDLLHPGHVQYLARAKQRCDRLLVAVNSDESVRRYKNPLRPINTELNRMFVVAGLESVDAVTRMDEDRPLPLLVRWKPDLYLKGGDYSAESLRSGQAVRQYGGSVEVIASDFRVSTSGLIERIAVLAEHAVPEKTEDAPPRALVLLDRDGTLIRDVPFLHDPAQVSLLPGVGEGLAQLQAAGLALAIVTNQQGIGLGYFTTQDFVAVNQRLFREFAPHGVLISRIYYCPHSASDRCGCRKPAPGMLTRAMRDFGVPPERTFFVGDSESDMLAAAAAGCGTVFTGKVPIGAGAFHAAGMIEAAEWILSRIAGPSVPAGSRT